MADQGQGGFVNWLVGLLSGKTPSVSAQPVDEEAQPTAVPTAQPTAEPQATATPTNSEVLQRMSPQASPTPQQTSMAHPAMKLQLAKAGLPQSAFAQPMDAQGNSMDMGGYFPHQRPLFQEEEDNEDNAFGGTQFAKGKTSMRRG